MRDLQFSRQQDAIVCAAALATLYPSYVMRAEKPAGCSKWRLACYSKRDGAADCFLTWYKG